MTKRSTKTDPVEPIFSREDAAALFDEATAAAAQAAAQDGAPPDVIEQGRYRVYQTPEGGWVIARAVNTCDRCKGCGCGDQADPIHVPPLVIQLARSQGTGLLGKLKALRNGG